jgi:hypothetical protein
VCYAPLIEPRERRCDIDAARLVAQCSDTCVVGRWSPRRCQPADREVGAATPPGTGRAGVDLALEAATLQDVRVSTSPPSRLMDLDEWSHHLAQVMEEASGLANETELREHVHQKVLAAIEDLYGMSWRTSTAEQQSARGVRRYYDRLYGGVAVEWEFDMKPARRNHGAEQALEYLQLLRRDQPVSDAYTAVVTDGKQWGFLISDPDEEEDLFSTAPSSPAEHFVWRPNSPAACRHFLELIGSHQQIPVTAVTLARLLGPEAELSHRNVAVLAQSLAARADSDRTDTLYREWRRALDVVYGDLDKADGNLADVISDTYDVPVSRSVGELLFVLHTYFALVARLVAVEILATSVDDIEFRPTAWRGLSDQDLVAQLERLDRGDLPGGLDIANLFEADLFSWWIPLADGNNDLIGALRELLAALGGLAFPRVVFGPAPAGDVLRDLYQALVPRQLRRALGEFLTPTWLAGACLESLATAGADLTDGRVLDPTCGTGTFLVPILTQRIRRLASSVEVPDEAAVQAVLDSVCGVDLNPVAVIATRVNYVVAMGDLASVGNLVLPVWRADSLLVPDAPAMQGDALSPLTGLQYRELQTSLPTPFPIPPALATAPRLARLRALIEDSVEGVGFSPDSLADRRARFEHRLSEEFGVQGLDPLTPAEWVNDRAVAAILLDQILDLAVAGRDGVWARIIENSFAPLFAGVFDVVVGNPPWLTWTKLPNSWRVGSQRVWRRYGLWRVPGEAGDSFSLASNDLATLVFAIALDRYLAEKGVLGLLTPDALLIADPGARAFRKFRLVSEGDSVGDKVDVRFALKHVDDWSRVQPFSPEAANRPVFIVAQKGADQPPTTAGTRWRRVQGAGRLGSHWRDVRRKLTAIDGDYRPVDANTPTSAWSFNPLGAPPLIAGGSNTFEFGKGLDTRGANGVYFVRLVSSDRARRRSVVENLPDQGRNSTVQTVRGSVESDLIYPLLRGRDVQAWVATPSVYFVLPHDPADLGSVLDEDELRTQYPQARAWLRRHHDVLSARKPPPTRSWRMDVNDWARVDGPLGHMAGNHIVVVREQQSRPSAAVIEARMNYELGRVVAPLVDHKLLFCSVDSREKALYLAAVINSTPMQDLLESFANSVAVSPTTLRRLPIPEFADRDPLMADVVRIASDRMAAVNTSMQADLQQQLDDRILHLITKDIAAYQPQARSGVRAARLPKTAPVDSEDRLF